MKKTITLILIVLGLWFVFGPVLGFSLLLDQCYFWSGVVFGCWVFDVIFFVFNRSLIFDFIINNSTWK